MRVLAVLLLCLLIGCSAQAAIAIRYNDDALLVKDDGTVIVPSGIYSDIVKLNNDSFAARKDGCYALMDADGEILTDFIYTELKADSDFFCAGINGEYMILDAEGVRLTQRTYSKIVFGSDGYAWALQMDGDQLIRLSAAGEKYMPLPEVDQIADTEGDGLLAVRFADSMLWGYCNSNGQKVIADVYERAEPFAGRIARIVRDGCYGVIDRSGKTVLTAEYMRLDISDSMIVGQLEDGTVSIFDREGNTLRRFEGIEYSYALFRNKCAVYGAERVILCDDQGETVAEYAANAISLFQGMNNDVIVMNGQWGELCAGLFGAADTTLWQVMHPLGYAQGRPVYRGGITEAVASYDSLLDETSYSMDLSKMRYAIVRGDGRPLTDNIWKSITYLEDDRFLAERDSDVCLINSRGKIYYTITK